MENNQNNKENMKPSKRMKNRNPKNHKRALNKSRREKGEEYTTKLGKVVPAKQFVKIICKCRKSCHLTINEAQQKEIFQQYYNLNTWTEKTSFLFNYIEVTECKSRRKPGERKNIRFKKSFTRKYFFLNKENAVCKQFFKKVLQISEGRVEKCVKKKQNMSSSCAIDLRGKHTHHKRTPATAISHAIKFMNSLPKYESHYAREWTRDKKYLAPNLNLTILYNEYINQCNELLLIPISAYMFRDTFYRKFNLKFKQPQTDTCDFCNKMNMDIKRAPIKSNERMQLIKDKENHLQCVENLRREFKDHVNESKLSADSKIVLVFDLEKVFPTPNLTTNSAYYKRKLSTYNLCIHDETHNRSYMYVWNESIASRGSQEIGSCLFYHIKHYVPSECEYWVLYSDSCGGQNRNINTSVMLSQFLEKSFHLKNITQHFFRTGHSYNVCDRKFAIIERKKRKLATEIYVPSQWSDLIRNAKETVPKFTVVEMNKEHFFGCNVLLSGYCTNRKKTTDKSTVNWLSMRMIKYEKKNPMMLHFETYQDVMNKYDENVECPQNVLKTLSVAKRNFNHGEFIQVELPILYPNGREISTEKLKDLLDLLAFIPQQFHKFYLDLGHSENIREEETVDISSDSDNEEV